MEMYHWIDPADGQMAVDVIQDLALSCGQQAGALADQSATGSFAEIGHACADPGRIYVMLATGAFASQAQLVGDGCAPMQESQNIGFGEGQEIQLFEGLAAGSALHNGVFQADQQAANLATTMEASATCLGLQSGSVTGAPGTPCMNLQCGVLTDQSQSSR